MYIETIIPGPEVIKIMLKSTELEILNAHKYKTLRNLVVVFFSGLEKPVMLYFPTHKCWNAKIWWYFNI